MIRKESSEERNGLPEGKKRFNLVSFHLKERTCCRDGAAVVLKREFCVGACIALLGGRIL